MLLKNYSPATLSPTGAVAPNEGCIIEGYFFLIYDGGGIKYFVKDADTIGLPKFFCLQQKSI